MAIAKQGNQKLNPTNRIDKQKNRNILNPYKELSYNGQTKINLNKSEK